MKKMLSLALLAFTLLTGSCKKEAATTPADDTKGFSEEIKNFVPQGVIDSMRNWGMKINEGKKPPVISGIYDFMPNYCSFDNSGYNRVGDKFADYRFRFRDQNNDNLTIALDYKALTANDTASGVGAFLAGNGNEFTVFVDVSGSSYGISYQQIGFYSGTFKEHGVKNFQQGFYLKEKGPDPTNLLVNVGTSRIFYDSDNLSDVSVVYKSVNASPHNSTLIESR